MVASAASSRRARPRPGALAAAALVAVAAACARSGDAPGPAEARAAAAADPAACPGEDPHTRHVNLGFACETCHPRGGEYGASGAPLPGGTPISGTITRGAPTTCAVTCHSPLGGPAQSVAWDAGHRPCVSCHVQQSRSAPGVVSAHGATDDDTVCLGCHDHAGHLRGVVQLSVAPGETVDEACIRCHSATRPLLAGGMAPLLVGWRDAAGDWHGDRAGTGHGGDLLPPYARGAPALACRACHDPHASANAFLLASTVNGTALPAGRIGRAGVGAEALCASCHVGDRHAQCMSCHTGGVDHAADGAACFWCHGHEGVSNMQPAVFPANHGPSGSGSCTHCHSDGWLPPAETTPPRITAGLVQVTDVGTSGATIAWETSEPATSYVELGDGGAGRVAGDGALVTRHRVALDGLSEATAYSYRIRSSDAMRNVAPARTLSFTTASSRGPLAPVRVDQPAVFRTDVAFTVTLRWSPVTDPDGGAVAYRVVTSESVGFETLASDSGWIAATEALVTVTEPRDPGDRYWRVQARDPDGVPSPWSATGWFPIYWSTY